MGPSLHAVGRVIVKQKQLKQEHKNALQVLVDAANSYNLAIPGSMETAGLVFNLGIFLQNDRKQHHNALCFFRHALAIYRHHNMGKARIAETLCKIAMILTKQYREDEAIETYNIALQAYTDSALCKHNPSFCRKYIEKILYDMTTIYEKKEGMGDSTQII